MAKPAPKKSAPAKKEAVKAAPQQRQILELMRNFMAISGRRQQEAICNLARSLANRDLSDDLDLAIAIEDEATAA